MTFEFRSGFGSYLGALVQVQILRTISDRINSSDRTTELRHRTTRRGYSFEPNSLEIFMKTEFIHLKSRDRTQLHIILVIISKSHITDLDIWTLGRTSDI